MVSGYTSFKEGFATTPTATEDNINDKISEITADIKELEETLKLKKDELVSVVKKQVKKETTLDNSNNKAVMYDDEDVMNEDAMNEDVINKDNMNEDVINEDDMNEDVMNEDVINEDVMNEDDMNEDDMNEDEDLNNETVTEPFIGSIIVSKSYLTDLLKAVLLSLLFYLLTSNDMLVITKPIHNAIKDVISHNVLHTLIFFVVAFGIIAFTM
jgi:pentapeptide MXKDX repeat protein